jgi:menaquinone-dependent protoporphyrinogen oxidase
METYAAEDPMKPWLIAYATREGQTRRIAEHVARHLEQCRVPTVIVDLSTIAPTTPFELVDYGAVILASSVHNRRHEPEAVEFARWHARELSSMVCVVLSVSSVEMIAESPNCSRFWRTLAARAATKLLADFCEQTGLGGAQTFPIAGALAYTKYSRSQRFAFQCFARLTGLPTDAAQDHSATDFVELNRRIDALLGAVQATTTTAVA